ncbi:hypothetical protein OIU78_006713 [Salix suchowensis]|nr:hypothetical protein OIU78_006713 [Salix suchowensis]
MINKTYKTYTHKTKMILGCQFTCSRVTKANNQIKEKVHKEQNLQPLNRNFIYT